MEAMPCQTQHFATEGYQFVYMILQHLVLLVPILVGLRSTFKNGREIKHVKRALNGKADSSEE